MKKFTIFIVSCVVIGLIVSLVFSALPIFPFVAKGFMVTLSQNQPEQAYAMLAPDFQKQYPLPSFASAMHSYGLDNYKDVAWSKSKTAADHKQGYISGMVTTKQNKKVEVTFFFKQIDAPTAGQKGWRISGIQIEQPKLLAPNAPSTEQALPKL